MVAKEAKVVGRAERVTENVMSEIMDVRRLQEG